MMTPEEIQQVVEDYRKSNSLNEIFNDKTKNFLRNFGRQNKDKVNGNGAQGSTNGAQGAQSSTTTGAQGAQSNDCLLYTSPSPRDRQKSRMPSSA